MSQYSLKSNTLIYNVDYRTMLFACKQGRPRTVVSTRRGRSRWRRALHIHARRSPWGAAPRRRPRTRVGGRPPLGCVGMIPSAAGVFCAGVTHMRSGMCKSQE